MTDPDPRRPPPDQRCTRCGTAAPSGVRRRDGWVCAGCDADPDQLPLIEEWARLDAMQRAIEAGDDPADVLAE